MDTGTQKQEIRRRLEGARNLPTLPGVVARLLEMVDSPETTGRQLGLELAKDQVLSAKILKLVNSGFYGFSQPISTIPHAVTMLGFETVKSLVVGSSVLEMMEEALPGLWEHSLACARTGTLIAQHIELAQPEEVSVIGLLHDLGKVLLFQCFADEFQRVRTLVDDQGMLFSDAEQAAMSGMTEWGITPGTPSGPTIRRTASNRMALRSVVRNSSAFHVSDSLKANLRERHRVSLAKRFPMLSGLDMEHTWGGVICMTRNYASAFGRIEPGVFSSVGYNGVGLARGTISGALLAEHVLGGESELLTDAKALAGPSNLPPKPIVALGVKARVAWYGLRNRGET